MGCYGNGLVNIKRIGCTTGYPFHIHKAITLYSITYITVYLQGHCQYCVPCLVSGIITNKIMQYEWMLHKSYMHMDDLKLVSLMYLNIYSPLWITDRKIAVNILYWCVISEGWTIVDEAVAWSMIQSCLTRWGRVTQRCVSKLGHHWFR